MESLFVTSVNYKNNPMAFGKVLSPNFSEAALATNVPKEVLTPALGYLGDVEANGGRYLVKLGTLLSL